MEILNVLSLLSYFLIFSILFYIHIKYKQNQIIIKNITHSLLNEFEKKKEMTNQINYFLSSASYAHHIANWRNKKVYKYISNKGKTYEFVEFLSERTNDIAFSEDALIFDRLSYKRYR